VVKEKEIATKRERWVGGGEIGLLCKSLVVRDKATRAIC
jgi:hypothetical protein